MVADIEELETIGRIRNLLKKSQCKRKSYFPKKMKNHFQSQMHESNSLEEIRT